ncbi:hypothetical protein ABI_13110 [Asticcacaulis biprosthecium C19]|uniref:Uncharacterized protein n=1 Tax=Asticcacaulis biprosthecium C19 TaxID=715226 RepID=F4QI06_9CAUL|nr:hypothetical protein ABI_13110 [Asticcacaulis biprosthecium C19]
MPPLIVEANSDGILMGDVAWSFDIFIASEKAKKCFEIDGRSLGF